MKTLVLHIGTYKTGTTSIQNTLYKNANYLIENGINYLGHEGGCSKKNGRQTFHNTLDFDNLVSYLQSEKGDVHIYSNECLWDSTTVRNKFISAVFKSRVYSNFLIMGYVRKQSEFIESFYKQEQAFGKQWAVGLTPLEFWKGLENKGTLDIHGTLSFFANKFGKDNMVIREYSNSYCEDKDIVDIFFSHSIFKKISITKTKNLNHSISANEAIIRSLSYSFLNKLNHTPKNREFNKNRELVNSFIHEELSKFTNNFSSKILTTEEKAMIDNYYSAENSKVKKDYGIIL